MYSIKPPKNLAGRFLVAGELIQLNDLVGSFGYGTTWKKSILFDTVLHAHLVGQYFRPSESYRVDKKDFYVAPQDEEIIELEVITKKMDAAKMKGILSNNYS